MFWWGVWRGPWGAPAAYMQIVDRRDDTVYRNTRSGDWDVIDALYEPLPATSFVPSDRLLEPLPPNFTDR